MPAAGSSTRSTPACPRRVAAYRGGYLPEERRALEQALRSGRLVGLAATNALELGIDVCRPGRRPARGLPRHPRRAVAAGRASRTRRARTPSAVLVARDDPLDTYLVHHPEALLGAPVEATVFDPDNPYVLGPHLCAAAQEVPLHEADLDLFGPAAPGGRRRADRGGPAAPAAARAGSGPTGAAPPTSPTSAPTGAARSSWSRRDTGRLLGTVDASRRHGTPTPGAVYVHQGETWLVAPSTSTSTPR